MFCATFTLKITKTKLLKSICLLKFCISSILSLTSSSKISFCFKSVKDSFSLQDLTNCFP